MPAYTTLLQKPLDTISWEDDNFIEELLKVVQLFRPFSEAMDEFLKQHGFAGDIENANAKAAFVRAVFAKANMDAPREVREWFAGQPVKRDTVFQICFAFGLDGGETDEFFRRIYTKERSFNCHLVQEAIYYFCLNNGLTWADALDIQSRAPLAGKNAGDGDVVYTGSIIAKLNDLESKEEMIDWLNENIDKFVPYGNVTAYETIRRLWQQAVGPDGLLIQEHQKLSSLLDDDAMGHKSIFHTGSSGAKPYDAYLAILQLDKKTVHKLGTDRSIKPILEKLHDDAQDSFPDRQGIELIIRGKHVSYERVRKWLVLLTFYTFWAKRALANGNYEAKQGDADRCIAEMNRYLIDCGYPELYVGNPYDWIFFYAIKDSEPLRTFRYIWNELLTGTLEQHQ